MNGIKRALPARPNSLCEWVAELGSKCLKIDIIKRYLTAVRSLYVDLGYNIDSFHNIRLERIIRRFCCLYNEPDKRERKPITRDILLPLLRRLDTSALYGATMHAAFSLAFAGLLRIEKITWSDSDIPKFIEWHPTRRSIRLSTITWC